MCAISLVSSLKEIQTADGAAILDVDGGTCFSLNPVAARIWQLLKAGHSIDQIAERISNEFTAPKEQVISDLDEFINTLRRHGFIQKVKARRKPFRKFRDWLTKRNRR